MTLGYTIGINVGNGYTKAQAQTSQSLIPSYFKQISDDDINKYEAFDDGAIISIVESSTRPELNNSTWLVGDTAKHYYPDSYGKVVDTLQGKLDYGLQMVLGAIARLEIDSDANINLLISIHDSQIFGKELKKKLDGLYRVKLNNSYRAYEIRILSRVIEEGIGAIASQISPNGSIGLIDLGHGTSIVSVFRKGKLLDGSRKVINVGVHNLIEKIANHPKTREKLHKQGNEYLIRLGLKNNFAYGTTGWEFSSIYALVLKDWISSCLAPSFKHLQPRIDELDGIYLTGGGALLPNINQIASKHSIITIQNAQMAEAIGLQKLASRVFVGV